MKIKRFIAIAIMVCLSFGAFALRSPAAFAVDSEESGETADAVIEGGYFDVTYEATDAYKNSKYYENLKKVPRTGNQAINVIAVALSQVGYHEGDDESDFDGLNADGDGDFVEYNMVFGRIDYNVRYGYSWCASFATWCLRQADIDPAQSAQTAEFNEEYKKTYISTWQWKEAFENAEAFERDKSYAPKTGDIIFFKDVDDPTIEVDTSHVGIVLYADEKNVYTVEGNTNSKLGGEHAYDCVAIKSYSLDSKYIVGYGKPAYKNNDESATYVWRDASEPSSNAKPLEDMIGQAAEGAQIVPEKYIEIPETSTNSISFGDIVEITYTSVVLVGIAALVVIISITVFGKKPNDSKKVKTKKKA